MTTMRRTRTATRNGRAGTSLADLAVTRLRRMIVLNMLKPGERLFEPQLGEMLGVSRTPVREALKLLAAEGLIALRRNRSAIVALLDPDELRSLFEVESGIESLAAGLAAARMSAADLRKLRALQERMERCWAEGRREDYIRINIQIHRLIVAGAMNPILAQTHSWLLGRLQRARNVALGTEGRMEESIREHRDILAALEARDAETAARLLARHVNRTGDIVAAWCARGDLTSPIPPAAAATASAPGSA
jgi:DNA-binding GntR family transcriptional regulator